MTDSEALITAARRYLKENHRYWADKYSKERTGDDYPYSYTDNDYNLFPRYNVLSAILGKVETLVGQNHMQFETCKKELRHIGSTANSMFTADEENKISANAMLEERNKFTNFIENSTPRNLKSVEPLAYRRRLKEDESQKVRQILFEQWNFQGDYWEPIEKLSPKPTIFLMKDIITKKDYSLIMEEIKKQVKGNLLELTEDGSDSEIEFSLFHPDCYETIYCDRTFEWIVYGSHEGTLAFGGDGLLNFIRHLFNGRQDELNKWK